MAIFQLEIADTDVQRVFDAICSNYGRPSSVANPDHSEVLDADGNPVVDEDGEPVAPVDADGNEIPSVIENPESQGAFTHRIVRQFLSDHVTAYEVAQAKAAASAAIDTNVSISDPDPT